jgi:hypothetical protein
LQSALASQLTRAEQLPFVQPCPLAQSQSNKQLTQPCSGSQRPSLHSLSSSQGRLSGGGTPGAGSSFSSLDEQPVTPVAKVAPVTTSLKRSARARPAKIFPIPMTMPFVKPAAI